MGGCHSPFHLFHLLSWQTPCPWGLAVLWEVMWEGKGGTVGWISVLGLGTRVNLKEDPAGSQTSRGKGVVTLEEQVFQAPPDFFS